MNPNKEIFNLLEELNFIPNSNKLNWSYYSSEKSFIIKILENNFNIIKIKHNFTEDGSFCSSISVGSKILNEEEFLKWLIKKKQKNCKNYE